MTEQQEEMVYILFLVLAVPACLLGIFTLILYTLYQLLA